MKAVRRSEAHRSGRGASAMAAMALAAEVLAGGGPVAAQAHSGGAGMPRAGSAAGVITTVVGGVGGPARATRVELFNRFSGGAPCGVSYGAGQLYIGDSLSVRRVNPSTDRLTTPAGTGRPGPLGDGGPATQASVDACYTAVAASGNLVISDTTDNRVRVAAASTGTFYGQPMTAGDIYTVAGNGTRGFAGDGGPAASARLSHPEGVAVDAAGNLLVADTDNSRVRVVAHQTGTFYGQPMTVGDIYTVAGNGTSGFSGDGGPGTSASLSFPSGVAQDAAGNLVIDDTNNNRVRVVAAKTGTFYGQPMTAGDIYTVAGNGTSGFAGDGGPAASAEVSVPSGVTADAAGNLVFADLSNNRVRVVAARGGTFYGVAMTAGDIYTVAGNGTSGFAGDGGPATSAELGLAHSLARDAAGDLLIADYGNSRIRKVTP